MAPMAVTESPAQTLLIDTDVHEMPSKGLTMQDLIPYMDPHWARFLNNNGGLWLGVPKPISYAAPVARGGVREDWIHGEALPGSVLEDMVKDLIEGEGVTTPILGGQLFYPTVLPGDPEFAAALASAYND